MSWAARRSFVAAAALTAMLFACSPVDQTAADSAAEGSAPVAQLPEPEADPRDCLLVVWSNQERREVAFDRAHDAVEGGAISCATGTSASQFAAAITALREAAGSADKARMLEQVGLPLLYIDGAGERHELGPEGVEAMYDEIFDPAMLDLLQRLDLADMAVENERGGYFELGTLWLVVDEDGGRPQLVTVNRQALDEASAAARRKAERAGGEPAPIVPAR